MSSWLIRNILKQSPVLAYRTRPPPNTKAIASGVFIYSKTVLDIGQCVTGPNRLP